MNEDIQLRSRQIYMLHKVEEGKYMYTSFGCKAT